MINRSESDSSIRNQTIRISLDIELCIKINPEDVLNRTSEAAERNQLADVLMSNNKSLEDNQENRVIESSEKENESMLSFGDHSGRNEREESSHKGASFSQFRMFPTVDIQKDIFNEDKQRLQQLGSLKIQQKEERENLERKEIKDRKPVELGKGQHLYIPKTLYNSGPLLIPFKQRASNLNFSNSPKLGFLVALKKVNIAEVLGFRYTQTTTKNYTQKGHEAI